MKGGSIADSEVMDERQPQIVTDDLVESLVEVGSFFMPPGILVEPVDYVNDWRKAIPLDSNVITAEIRSQQILECENRLAVKLSGRIVEGMADPQEFSFFLSHTYPPAKVFADRDALQTFRLSEFLRLEYPEIPLVLTDTLFSLYFADYTAEEGPSALFNGGGCLIFEDAPTEGRAKPPPSPGLFQKRGLEKFPIHPGDVADGDVFGADRLAFPLVGAVAESLTIHGLDHAERPLLALRVPLGQEGELGDLGPGKEHGRTVGATGHAGPAADTGGRIHGQFRLVRGDGNGVAVRGAPGVDRNIAAGLDNPVQTAAIHDQVLPDGKGPGAEGFDYQGVAVAEVAHVELAEGGPGLRAMGDSVDHGPAHPADPFPAVMVKGHRIPSFPGQVLVEDIEHLQERHVRGDVVQGVLFKGAGGVGVALAPDFQIEGNGLHNGLISWGQNSIPSHRT